MVGGPHLAGTFGEIRNLDGQFGQRRAEIIGDRCDDGAWLPVGEGNGQRVRVQGEAREPVLRAIVAVDPTVSVAHVANDRVGKVFEMASELVQTPGVRMGFDQATAVDARRGDGAKARDRGHTRAVLARGNGVVEVAFAFEVPSDQGEIPLADATGSERVGEPTGGLDVQREQQCAAGATIEAMKRVHASADGIAHSIDGGHVVLGPAAMHEHAGGFVSDDDMLVRIEQLDRGGHGMAR